MTPRAGSFYPVWTNHVLIRNKAVRMVMCSTDIMKCNTHEWAFLLQIWTEDPALGRTEYISCFLSEKKSKRYEGAQEKKTQNEKKNTKKQQHKHKKLLKCCFFYMKCHYLFLWKKRAIPRQHPPPTKNIPVGLIRRNHFWPIHLPICVLDN